MPGHVIPPYLREYYFSAENLQKDFFLRRQMDSEGYVPLTVVGRFNRVRALTQDIGLIKEVGGGTHTHTMHILCTCVTLFNSLFHFRQAMQHSDVVEMSSYGDRIRQKEGWIKWLGMGPGTPPPPPTPPPVQCCSQQRGSFEIL